MRGKADNMAEEKDKRKRSLSSALTRTLLLIVLVILISFLVSVYLVTKSERQKTARQESENVLRTLSSNIESNIRSYAELSRLIMTDDKLVSFLRAEASTVDIGRINDARYAVMDILNVTEGVDSVMIFREDLILFSTNRFSYRFDMERLNGDEWKEDILAARGRAVVSLNNNYVARKADHKPTVTIGREINDLNTQKRIGILLMNISPAIYDRMLRQLRYNNICILGDEGTFLAGNREIAEYDEEIFHGTGVVHRERKEGRDRFLLSGSRVSGYPIVILRLTPYGKGVPYGFLYVLLGLLLIIILLVLRMGTFIGQNITRPVFELSRRMEHNKQSGSLKKIEMEIPYRELDMLKGDYNDMIDHVNELFERVIENEKTLQRAEMRVLQEQIKPHFLYNSIETISFLALDAGADKVYDALETMGSFYRNFLSKGSREIELAQEIRIVKDYLSLQKLRYGDIIEDEYEIAPEAEHFVVPKLILQPLVENCIYHGIRLKGEPGVIRITARMEEDELVLTVRDTGVGMSQEQIERILKKDRAGKETPEDESFGLWGTIERIRIYCDRQDVVRIVSEPGEYTEITFRITGEGGKNEQNLAGHADR